MDGRFYANVEIEGMSVRALVYTGSTVTYIAITMCNSLTKRAS